jgi:hypothetical protein
MTGATSDVPAQDSGIASATVNSAQQMGGSIGSAVFNTVAASGAAVFHGSRRAAALHGFTSAIWIPLALLLLAAVATATLAGHQSTRVYAHANTLRSNPEGVVKRQGSGSRGA